MNSAGGVLPGIGWCVLWSWGLSHMFLQLPPPQLSLILSPASSEKPPEDTKKYSFATLLVFLVGFLKG